jgi:aminopeptidase N
LVSPDTTRGATIMTAGRATRLTAVLLALATACADGTPPDPEPGVSVELARHRSATVSNVRYGVQLRIPEQRTEAVTGKVTVSFAMLRNAESKAAEPLILDFRGDSNSVRNVRVNGDSVTPRVVAGHVVIPSSRLRIGENSVEMMFVSSDEALNRNDEFMYALFVPDRAATAFPSFDQPDIKARYSLALDVPAGWRTIANGSETTADTSDGRLKVTFGETQPISTYLFSFAAGKFLVEQAQRDGRLLTMLHRETDSAKVARNRDAIFDLHATALRWLEEYTKIPYPFGKFAFLAVPSFQFGGMEHPGAVWYRAASLFLDESATQNQRLGRASLIAHETAHMWFGDLVTMRWFNDVWMKEVFANFMAAKIVQPSFPELDHNLRFATSYHPSAYGVDRTTGANPIRQELENLRQAGSVYGAIIYQKAPVVMRQLEQMVGDSVFREGMRRYLDRYKFANATWSELVDILDDLTDHDLVRWSRAWVEESGRPQIEASWNAGTITVRQRDHLSMRKLRWQQVIGVAYGVGDSVFTDTVTITEDSAQLMPRSARRPDWILPGVDGVSYGNMVLDSTSRTELMWRVSSLREPLHRATAMSALWESVLTGETAPRDFLALTLRALPLEREELLTQQLLGYLRSSYWRLLSDSARSAVAPEVEAALWSLFDKADGVSRKSAYWGAIVNTTLTGNGVARLHDVWARREPPGGLPLSEQQFTSLAEELALRGYGNVDSMLDIEATRITNPDRRARFAYVRPSLSTNGQVRDSVFESLRKVENRRRESWTLDALRNLNHPLRASHGVRYIRRGLELVDEIQRTGDIFFPLSWMNALLDGHNSAAAATAVATFLDETPKQQPRLRGKTLQAADDLFRAARIVDGWKGGPTLEGDIR